MIATPPSSIPHDTVSSRREARERAMQVLYAFEVSGEPIEMLVESIGGSEFEPDSEQYHFFQGLVYAVLRRKGELDEAIKSHVRNWDVARMALLDRIILRLGACEFSAFEDIPPKVTINEYVDIAKRFSTEGSGKFVNGMLDALLKDLTAQGKVKKTGRGLLGQ